MRVPGKTSDWRLEPVPGQTERRQHLLIKKELDRID